MKKKALSSYCIILMLFCQVLLCCGIVNALSDNGSSFISNNCEQIRQALRNVQHSDSRTRVYIGGYYEKFISKYITPLNVRLTRNNITGSPAPELMSNQAAFATAQANFKDDFIDYQKELEELISFDCGNAQGFYAQLGTVREKRQTMVFDIAKVAELTKKHLELARQLRGQL